MKLSDLKLNLDNPRVIKDEKFKKLCESLNRDPEFMETHQIGHKDGIIYAGNMRYKALQELGYTEIPDSWLVDISKWDEEKIRRYVVVDNLGYGEWDWDILANNYEKEELEDWGMDIDKWAEDLTKEDKIPETTVETDIKTGDIYKLGKHILICGDSKEYNTFERLMGGDKAKLVFTSPPYNIGGGMYNNYRDNLESQEYIDFNLEIIKNCQAFLNGFLFWNISYNKKSRWEFIEIFYKIIKEYGLKFLELIVWDKGHGMPITSKEMLTRQYEDILLVGNEENIKQDIDYYFCGVNKTAYFNKKTNKGITNYWKIGTNKTQINDNKACFPVALPLKAIEMMTVKDDLVLDPFMGSGSTLIACEKSGRICRGIELDPILCQLTIDRFKEYTGQKAVKL